MGVKTMLHYLHLSPDHLRNEVTKTERKTAPQVTAGTLAEW